MRTIPDETRSDHIPLAGVGHLLARWQAEGDADDFTGLVMLVHEPLARMAARTLRRHGIRDPGVCDDVVSIVLERLFRLGTGGGVRPHAAFDHRRIDSAACVDPGWAFVRCIARSRAHDAARAVRRRVRLAADYAAAGPRHAGSVDHALDARDAFADGVEGLQAAIATLDERSREVIGLLLDGKSQTVIAHVFGVSEGTVSRIRAKAIARLRDVLSAQGKRGGGGGVSRRPRCAGRG